VRAVAADGISRRGATVIDRNPPQLARDQAAGRQPSDLPRRFNLPITTAPVTGASRRGGSGFAILLRDRAAAA
jgi:hypothetical protein